MHYSSTFHSFFFFILSHTFFRLLLRFLCQLPDLFIRCCPKDSVCVLFFYSNFIVGDALYRWSFCIHKCCLCCKLSQMIVTGKKRRVFIIVYRYTILTWRVYLIVRQNHDESLLNSLFTCRFEEANKFFWRKNLKQKRKRRDLKGDMILFSAYVIEDLKHGKKWKKKFLYNCSDKRRI